MLLVAESENAFTRQADENERRWVQELQGLQVQSMGAFKRGQLLVASLLLVASKTVQIEFLNSCLIPVFKAFKRSFQLAMASNLEAMASDLIATFETAGLPKKISAGFVFLHVGLVR